MDHATRPLPPPIWLFYYINSHLRVSIFLKWRAFAHFFVIFCEILMLFFSGIWAPFRIPKISEKLRIFFIICSRLYSIWSTAICNLDSGYGILSQQIILSMCIVRKKLKTHSGKTRFPFPFFACDGRTDGPTNGRTDRSSYGYARTHKNFILIKLQLNFVLRDCSNFSHRLKLPFSQYRNLNQYPLEANFPS